MRPILASGGLDGAEEADQPEVTLVGLPLEPSAAHVGLLHLAAQAEAPEQEAARVEPDREAVEAADRPKGVRRNVAQGDVLEARAAAPLRDLVGGGEAVDCPAPEPPAHQGLARGRVW